VVAGKIVNIYQHFSTGHADVFAGQVTEIRNEKNKERKSATEQQ